MDTAHNRHSVEHNTHFIVIAASLVCWVPSLVLYCIHFLSQEIFPDVLAYISQACKASWELLFIINKD